MGKAVRTQYNILYLPTGELLRSSYDVNKGTVVSYESEEAAFALVVSLCRKSKPPHAGFMDYNGIIFPSIIKHFHIVEDP